jgi:hypothetical protein
MVEMTAGEDVPKLISAADDARTISELLTVKFAGNSSGMPEVVRAEEAAVGAIVEEMTSMLSPVFMATESGTELLAKDTGLLEDSSCPRPPDRDTADATVGTADDSASGLVRRLGMEDMRDSETGFEASDDEAPASGNVPVRVEVQSDGSMSPGVVPPRTGTTAGVDVEPGVSGSKEDGFS